MIGGLLRRLFGIPTTPQKPASWPPRGEVVVLHRDHSFSGPRSWDWTHSGLSQSNAISIRHGQKRSTILTETHEVMTDDRGTYWIRIDGVLYELRS